MSTPWIATVPTQLRKVDLANVASLIDWHQELNVWLLSLFSNPAMLTTWTPTLPAQLQKIELTNVDTFLVWLESLSAWLLSLFGQQSVSADTFTVTATWSTVGDAATATISGNAAHTVTAGGVIATTSQPVRIDTTRPIVDHNPTPRTWTVSTDQTSISTAL